MNVRWIFAWVGFVQKILIDKLLLGARELGGIKGSSLKRNKLSVSLGSISYLGSLLGASSMKIEKKIVFCLKYHKQVKWAQLGSVGENMF